MHAYSSCVRREKANIMLQVFLYQLLDNRLIQHWLVANFDVY